MGKRYYCDYCDKSFADNPTNRRLHLTGGIHLRNKKTHYDAVRDEREILQDDIHKKPCRSYMTSGDCRFGARCQYSHLTEADKAKLRDKIHSRDRCRELREKKEQEKLSKFCDLLPKWLDERSKKLELESQQGGEEENEKGKFSSFSKQFVPKYEMAECLRNVPNLPPSLQCPNSDDILNASYAEWG